MYKLCKTEQSALRQRELENGLLEAMLTVRFEDISVSDLCDRMQIPRKSFYRYFSSKDGALQALLDHTILEYERISAFISFGSQEKVYREMVAFFNHWQQHSKLLDALARSDLSGMLVERSIAHALEEHRSIMVSEAAEVRHIHTHAIAFVACGTMTMVVQWHRDGYRETPQEMARTAAHILTHPLVPEHRIL